MSKFAPFLVVVVLSVAACADKASPPAKSGPDTVDGGSTEATATAAPVAVDEPAAVYVGDLSGTWNYVTSNRKVSGMCPAGPETSGTCAVKQSNGTLSFEFSSGQTCKPASMCSYAGTVQAGSYSVSNSDSVDGEGGKVTNTIHFAATSATTAKGSGTSKYEHPAGMQCTWTYDINLTK